MNVHNNDPEKFIVDPEDFIQYNSWLISGNEENIIHIYTTQDSTAQLNGGPNYHFFTYITMFTYTRPLK